MMNLKNKKVLVTGAGGFIGSHLTEKLVESGADVTAFVRYTSNKSIGFIADFDKDVRKNINIEFGDILDPQTVRDILKDIDVVFHLAASISVAYSFERPSEVIEVNSRGTLNVLNAAKDLGTERVIVTSSSEVYGTAKFVPITEEHPLQGQSPYSASKISAEKFSESFYRAYDMPITIVRPFNTYGPRQSTRAVIPTVITQALTKEKIHLGSLTPRRDFLYVKDTVNGFIKIAEALEKTKGEAINLATGEDISIKDMTEMVNKILNKDLPIVADDQRTRPENAEVNRLCGDFSKVKELIGWTPKYKLEEGLKETIEWISAHMDLYRPDEYFI